MRTRLRAAVAGITALVTAGSLASCGLGGGSDSVAHKSTLVIGVKADQPGLGLKGSNGTFAGFDVDVATYVAKELGAKHVKFVAITSGEREAWLESGKVDMVVASYSITPTRKTKVLFAGPYYVAHQDLLVRADDNAITNVRSLQGKKLCRVQGSDSFTGVTVEKGVAAVPVDAASYSACVQDLVNGSVEAVSTDDLILAGFANDAQYKGKLKLVNSPFTDERYGIGLNKSDVEGCEDVNKALTDMYLNKKEAADTTSDTGETLLKRWFDGTHLTLVPYVPQFEGCS